MISEENHPRNETPEQRDQAYKNLNKLIRRKITQHAQDMDVGRLALLKDADDIQSSLLIASFRTPDDVEMDLTLIRGISRSVGNYAVAGVTVMHEANVQGARTEYESIDHESFTRTDYGVDARSSISQDSPFLLQLMNAELQVITKMEDIKAGLDGHVISAYEANAVADAIEGAEYYMPGDLRHNR